MLRKFITDMSFGKDVENLMLWCINLLLPNRQTSYFDHTILNHVLLLIFLIIILDTLYDLWHNHFDRYLNDIFIFYIVVMKTKNVLKYVSLHESIKALIASVRVLYLQNQIARDIVLVNTLCQQNHELWTFNTCKGSREVCSYHSDLSDDNTLISSFA